MRVALSNSLCKHLAALQDGCFLVDFYTCHLKVKLFNTINQRYWLEYHPIAANPDPLCHCTTHLLSPSTESPTYADTQGLCPFRQWARLPNSDTFIHGPVNFATVNNRKSRDRIFQENWTTLHSFGHLFTNQASSIDLPEYSIHFGHFHTTYVSDAHAARVTAILATPSSSLLV